LERDKFNDIKNVMFLKGKIITDTKKVLPLKKDFKMFIKQKNEEAILEEKRDKEMAKMVLDLEKKINNNNSPTPSSNMKSPIHSRFNSVNFDILAKKRSTLRDLFTSFKNLNHSKPSLRGHNKVLADFKTKTINVSDTESRINAKTTKNVKRKEFIRNKVRFEQQIDKYIIKNKFLPHGTGAQVNSHHRLRSQEFNDVDPDDKWTCTHQTLEVNRLPQVDSKKMTESQSMMKLYNSRQSLPTSDLLSLKHSDKLNSETPVHKKSKRLSSTGAEKVCEYEQKRLKGMKDLGKAYLKDYTEFNFKIDSILNEGYTFIKRSEPAIVHPSRIVKFGLKDGVR